MNLLRIVAYYYYYDEYICLRHPFNTHLSHIAQVFLHSKSCTSCWIAAPLNHHQAPSSFRATLFILLLLLAGWLAGCCVGWCVIKSALLWMLWLLCSYIHWFFIPLYRFILLPDSGFFPRLFIFHFFFYFLFFGEAEICFYCHCVCAINYAILLFCHSFSKYWPRRRVSIRSANDNSNSMDKLVGGRGSDRVAPPGSVVAATDARVH